MSVHSSKLKLRTPPPPPQGPPPPGAQRGSPDTVGSYGSFDDDERTPSPPPSSFARQHARPAPAPPPMAIRAGQQGGFSGGNSLTKHGGSYFQDKKSSSQPPPPPDHPPRFTPRARGSPSLDRSRSPGPGEFRSGSPGISLAADFSASAVPRPSLSPRSRRSSGRSVGSVSSRAIGSPPPGVFDTSPRGSPRVSPRMSPRSSFADRSVAEDFEIDFSAAEAALVRVLVDCVADESSIAVAYTTTSNQFFFFLCFYFFTRRTFLTLVLRISRTLMRRQARKKPYGLPARLVYMPSQAIAVNSTTSPTRAQTQGWGLRHQHLQLLLRAALSEA